MSDIFSPNESSSTKQAIFGLDWPSWEDLKYYYGTPQGRRESYKYINPFPVISSWLQPDVSTILQDPKQRQAVLNALSNALQDPKQQQALQDVLVKTFQDPKQQKALQDMLVKAFQDPKQQKALQDILVKTFQDPQRQQLLQDMLVKAFQDPQRQQLLQDMLVKAFQDPQRQKVLQEVLSGVVNDPQALQTLQKAILERFKDPQFLQAFRNAAAENPLLRQQLEQEIGKAIAGYFTLPGLLALLSSFATDKPMIPLLLGLAGLGIAYLYPEVREKINLVNWASALKNQSSGTPAENRPQT